MIKPSLTSILRKPSVGTGLIDGRGLNSHSQAFSREGRPQRGDPAGKERSCCCHGVCIGILRPEAISQQTEFDHERKK
jgi:hypothetical protein